MQLLLLSQSQFYGFSGLACLSKVVGNPVGSSPAKIKACLAYPTQV